MKELLRPIGGLATWMAAGLAIAQTPSFKETLSIPTVGTVQISPDGTRVAYTVGAPDWNANTYRSQIWVYDLATRERVQLTRGPGLGAYAWSPDGHRIAFTSTRGGTSQIYLIDLNGGEAAKLTDIKEGVDDFDWSPDGRKIEYQTTPADPGRSKRKEEFGDFTVVESDENRTRIGVLNVPSSLPDEPVEGKLLTESAPFHASGAVWSPDSTRLLILASPGSALRHVLEQSVYVVDVATARMTKLIGPASIGGGVWSPDGKTIAYTETPNLSEAFYANNRVFEISASGGEPKAITVKLDEQINLLKWTPKGILFEAQLRTSNKLFRLDPVSGSYAELSPKDNRSRGPWSFSEDGTACAYRVYSDAYWAQIGVSKVDAFADRTVPQPFSPPPSLLPTRAMVQWRSKDGTEIEGVLIKPHDFNPAKKYPLLVMIHGGPTGTSDPVAGRPYAYPIEQWVNRGAIVLEPNYRGSAGYGAAFRALNVRNLGVGDEWDVLSGVDYLVKQGFVDESRMGCMGWSQGGYISAFITTTSDRFKAISVGAGISDWATYYYLTDITDFTRQYLKSDPWTDPEIYRKTSPITYVKNAKTPTLIQQGSNDARVPVPNGYELFRALQDLHIPSRFILYTGFGHGVSKPKEQLALLQHNWDWFGFYIWGDKAPQM